MGIDNDTRGWVMTVVSGIGMTFGKASCTRTYPELTVF
jgi:hypothetical protein